MASFIRTALRENAIEDETLLFFLNEHGGEGSTPRVRDTHGEFGHATNFL